MVLQLTLKGLAARIPHLSCADQKEGQGVRTPPPPPPPPPPPENHKDIGFLTNIVGSGPLKNLKIPNQFSMMGQHRHASETPLLFGGGPTMAHLKWYFDSLVPHKKRCQNLTPSEGASFGINLHLCFTVLFRLWSDSSSRNSRGYHQFEVQRFKHTTYAHA